MNKNCDEYRQFSTGDQTTVNVAAKNAQLSDAIPALNFGELLRLRDSMKVKVFAATTLGMVFDALDASIYFMVLHPALSDLLQTKSDAVIGWYGSIILCVFMVGWGIGSLVFGMVADKIGRAKTMIMTIMLYAVATALCSTSQDWIHLAIYRFFVGLGIGAEISVGSVMLSEFFTGKKRILACCLMQSGYAIGYLGTSLANLCVGNLSWRVMFLIGIVPAFLALYIRNKVEEPEHFIEVQRARQKAQTAEHNLDEKQLTALKNPLKALVDSEHLKTTVTVVSVTGVAIVGYWAALSWIPAWVNQLTGTLAVTERSVVGVSLNISSLLACLATYPLVFRFGRKKTMTTAFLISLISTLGMFLGVKAYGALLIGMVFVVGFFTTIPFVILGIMIPELYSTELLASASGLAFSVGRIVAAAAAILSGEIITIFSGSYAAAGASVSIIYIVGFIVSFFMPETKGEVLGTTLLKNPKTKSNSFSKIQA